MAKISPQGIFTAVDATGTPYSGGLLYTYEAGTSTPKATYTSSAEDTANANPVVLDSNGRAKIWLESGAYKYVLHNSADVLQWSEDNIIGEGAAGLASTIITTAVSIAITTANKNNLILVTASATLSLLAAATAGEGFLFTVRNDHTSAITIDPNAAETIDGAATLSIGAGQSMNIVCDGTNWQSFNSSFGFAYTASKYGAIVVQNTSDDGLELLSDQGTSGQVLTSAGADALPTWEDASSLNGEFAATNSGQAITTGTFTKISLSTEVFDTNGWFDSSTNYRFTPLEAGKYLIIGSGYFDNFTTSIVTQSMIYFNGSAVTRFYNTTSVANQNIGHAVSATLDFNGTTDYAEFYVHHGYGSNRNFNNSNFMAIRVGA